MTMPVLAIIVLLIVVVFGYIYYSSKRVAKEGINNNNQYKNFGFSYIAIAQVLNFIISLALGILATAILLNEDEVLAIIAGFLVLGISYYFLNFSIIKFRNNAIIAKTNTEILEELKKLSDK